MRIETIQNTHTFKVADRWCLHSYYSLCPYARDGSGRILIAGADLKNQVTEVIILDSEGRILDRFGQVEISPSFWHTGLWQSWSPDGHYVYYQSGSLKEPQTTRRDLRTGEEISIAGDIEGTPPQGETALSCHHGMLYAAGYGGNGYNPSASPVPFQARNQHGISKLYFDDPSQNHLALSTQDILDQHPLCDKILEADRVIKERLGEDEGLTLMTYCVRWSHDGQRCLFFFGNHCVVPEREEPKITSIFTSDRNLTSINLAIDLSFDRTGVHWAWQADGEHLIGYGPDPEDPSRQCLAEVRYDGSGYRKLSSHHSGGHPSSSPLNPDLLVTDEGTETGGNVVFISKRTGDVLERVPLPKFIGDSEPEGRNPLRICHHPVFNHSGDRVLCNSLPAEHAVLIEIEPPQIDS